MIKYICCVCDYVYDPEIGEPENDIPSDKRFEDLPADWVCLDCAMSKKVFSELLGVNA